MRSRNVLYSVDSSCSGMFKILMALRTSSRVSFTRNTVPIPPCPNNRIGVYRPGIAQLNLGFESAVRAELTSGRASSPDSEYTVFRLPNRSLKAFPRSIYSLLASVRSILGIVIFVRAIGSQKHSSGREDVSGRIHLPFSVHPSCCHFP